MLLLISKPELHLLFGMLSCHGCHLTSPVAAAIFRHSFHLSALTPTGLPCIYQPLQRWQLKWSPSPSLSFFAMHYHPSVSFYICIALVSSDRSVEMVSRQEQPTVSPMTNTDLIQRLAKCRSERQISAITPFTDDKRKSLHTSAEYNNWFAE